jgi:hypothetical protein
LRDILKVVQAILAELDHPRALTVKLLLDAGEWVQLVNLRAEAADYDHADAYRRAAYATELLRKADFLPTGIDRKAVAVKGFFAAEQQCYRTNERLYRYVFQPPRLNGAAPEAILALARKNIASWLGRFSDLRVAELAGHGPGATYDDRGGLSTAADKMSSDPTLSHDAWNWLVPFSGTAWARALNDTGVSDEEGVTSLGFAKRLPKFVPGNRFTSVPKDATKDRGICVEPSLNVYFQLGIGRLIKERLRKSTGIDLQYAQPVHRARARAASIGGEWATIDLSNASDTVCRNIVKVLLPPDWLAALESLRSPRTFIEGKWVLLEKFSSMGNGFTFELETLIFLALAQATSDFLGCSALPGRDILVYGDDIIVPTKFATELLVVLEFCGFTPNPKKTFVCGSFRESCGGDFFNGEDVRPLHIKTEPSEPFDWMVLANRVRSKFREGLGWKRCVDHLPLSWRKTAGPDHCGDVCLHTTGGWNRRTEHSITYQRAMLPIPTYVGWEHFRPGVVMATALYGAGDGRKGVTPRASVSGYRLGWITDS